LAVFPGFVQAAGSAGFVEQIGKFPVLYLDEDTCVFAFPPLRVEILARKEPWPRELESGIKISQ
jgi:hypothetical protein